MTYTYNRVAATPDSDQLLDQLDALKALDANLSGVEEAFGAHFKMASLIKPEIKSQMAAKTKAVEGLNAAQTIQQQAERILRLYPDDKTAQRAKMEADRMVERFLKHKDAAQKIVTTLARKEWPEALKKEVAAAVKVLEAKLVDPSVLHVIPWQAERLVWVPAASSWGRGSDVNVLECQAVFVLDGAPRPNQGVLAENTGTVEPGVYGSGFMSRKQTTGKAFAEEWIKTLRGWPMLKGEAEATAGRAQIAKDVARAIDSAIGAMRAWMSEKAQISKDNLRVSGSYRSNLPKEGASSVGEWEYDRMRTEEISAFRKVLDPRLAPFKDKIQSARIHDGEKSWIYVDVTLA